MRAKKCCAFPGLHTAVTSEESMAINSDPTPKVILSASGMCEAGRIRHHLKHNLWRPECTILFVGYQAEGSLGRAILEGAPEVKLFGEIIRVNAHIEQMDGISGHADRDMLLDWLGNLETPPEKVYVNHGDDMVCETLCRQNRGNPGLCGHGALYRRGVRPDGECVYPHRQHGTAG